MEYASVIPQRYHYPSPGFQRYWQQGRGKKLAKVIQHRFPEEEEIRGQIPLLNQVDAFADRVIREILPVHGFRKMHEWIQQANAREKIPEIALPLQELINFSMQQPEWLDSAKLEKGAQLCRRSGARGLIVLRNYCLMGGYESSAINKPLIFTGALKKGAAKRMAETTEFWVRVIAENALTNSGNGIKECLTVRLMHSHARVSILNEGHWKSEEWGQPLNLWDMLATNLGFSIVFLHGLRLLGMRPDKDEVEGLFHLWKYIGYLLGIPTHLLPENEADAVKSLYCWTITQPPADDDTKALAHALMLEPLSSSFPKQHWLKKRAVQIHLGYNYFFLREKSCQAMGLPVKGFTVYPHVLRLLTGLEELLNRLSPRIRQRTIHKRRQQQEKIACLFLKGHKRTS